jgi:guanylate kinase
LWLSRSWTTRPRRPHEPADAYVFVDRDAFLAAKEQGGFLETNEYAANKHLYGTPWPDPPEPGHDVVLEIDLNGAKQVKQRFGDAVAILVEPPSADELERRLKGRGDPDEQVHRRLELADVEVREGRQIADHVVINDDLDAAVDDVVRILEGHRRTTTGDV